MTSIPLKLRWLLVLLATLGLGAYAYTHLRIEQDIVASLERSYPEQARVFHEIQGSGFFQDRLYFSIENENEAERKGLEAALQEASYHIEPAFRPTLQDPAELYALLPFLKADVRERLLSPEHRLALVARIKELAFAPGGLGMIRLLEKDPLLLSQELMKLMPHSDEGQGKAPLLAKREGDLNWEKIRRLYEYLKAHDKNVSFLGGDFFALENYDAVHHDIFVSTLLSTLLSLVAFRSFCRQWSLLGFLLFGTALSSVVSLVSAEIGFGSLYGLVLAFTSTFVSFNNESLVHLSGIPWQTMDRKQKIGIFSALGTTVIGFLVLLFSSSHLTRQLAVLSLGSLVGFLAFLYIFRDRLQAFRFRHIDLPRLPIGKRWIYALSLLTVLGIVALPKPDYRTDLVAFRFASPYLEAQTERFNATVKAYSLDELTAVPKGAYDALLRDGRLDTAIFHPLQFYVPPSEQSDRIRDLQPKLRSQIEALRGDLEAAGIRLPPTEAENRDLSVLDRSPYLALWQKIWPLPWESRDHLLVFLKNAEPKVEGAIPMHPRAFYEKILSELTANLGGLFLIGLFVMLVYLAPWQKSLDRLLLIFLPLLVALLVLQVLFLASGRSITIVHIMGLALVISVALDYGAVLVSNEHDPKEQGKVLLTGGLTLASFGSLLFARHPVLHELALIVCIGTVVAWLLALFTRTPVERGKT